MPIQTTNNAQPAGLLSRQGGQALRPPMAQPPGGKEQTASPQNPQQQLDVFMAHALQVIHDRNVSDNVALPISKMKDRNKVIDYIARIAMDVFVRVEAAASAKGIKIDNNVKLAAGNQIVGEIVNIAQITGIKKLTDEEKAKAFSLCTSLYLERAVKTGQMTPEEVMQLSEQLKQSSEGQKIEKTRHEIMTKARKGGKKISGEESPQEADETEKKGLLAPKGRI